MQVEITGRHMDVTEGIREHVGVAFDKLSEHFELQSARLVFAKEGHREGPRFTVTAEVVAEHGEKVVGKATEEDCYFAIDEAVSKVDRQLDSKNKRSKNRKGRGIHPHVPEEVGRNYSQYEDENEGEALEEAV